MTDLGHETLSSRDTLQKRLTCKDGEAARDNTAREKFEVEHRDAKLKLEMIKK